MDIFTSSDRNYLKYLKVLMASTYVNHTPDTEINFYVLHSTLTEEEQAGVREFAGQYGQTAFFLHVDEEKYRPLFDRFSSARWTTACLYICFAHELLPRTIHRALYLDIDIAVNGDLIEFYNLDFDDCYLIASKPQYNAKDEPEHEFEVFERHESVDLIDAVKGSIFNSGVLMFNLDKFRKDAIDVAYYLNALGDAEDKDIFFDQGVLNAAFATKTKIFTICKYNYRLHYSAREYFKRNNDRIHGAVNYTFYPLEPKIIHYCGHIPGNATKPWRFYFEKASDIGDPRKEFLDMIPECVPYFNIWWDYARLTPDYEELRQTGRMNNAAYQMIKKVALDRRQEFCNRLGLDSHYVPVWIMNNNSILAEDDLNSFTRLKVYRCANNQIKETLKNLPAEFTEKCGFRLTVKHISGNRAGENDTPTLQILEPNDPTAAVYRRQCDNPRKKNWGKWYRMATTDDLTLLREQQDRHAQMLIRLAEELAAVRDERRHESGGGEHPSGLETELALTERALKASQTELSNIKASVSFRLGRVITFLPRMVLGWLERVR